MKIGTFLIHFILLSIILPCFGQEPYQASKIIPASPTAASLGVYGDLNVSYYTGLPDLSIPLYEIKTSNHTIPIVMNYNASGIRVSENAGWVGLSWSLSASGVITRTIRGGDDFGNNGYYIAEALPAETSPLLLQDKPYFDAVLNNQKDAEPDIFSYNFGNFSGKFVLGKQTDGAKIYSATQNNFKIEFIPAEHTWIITTGEGYKYYFGQQEGGTDYYYSSAIELANDAPLNLYSRDFKPDPITAWYLDRIISPTGELISFEYQIKSSSLSLVNKSESKYNLLESSQGCSTSPGFQGLYKTFNSSRQVIQDLYLTKITFALGTIEFNTTDRDDIEYTGAAKPKKLSEIVIKNGLGELIKEISFTHSYFNNSSGFDRRLKLDAIAEYGADGSAKPPHSFSYFDPESLPPKYTKSIDHWGFYNAQDNTTLLPSSLVSTVSPERFFTGGIRVPLGNDVALKKGVLQKITYPTGGSTDFDYETHAYRNPTGDDRYLLTPKRVNVITDPWHTNGYNSAYFDITSKTNVTFSFNFQKVAEDGNSIDYVRTEYAYVYKTGVTTPIYSFSNFYCSNGSEDLSCATSTTNDRSFSALLAPGNYRIEVGYLYPYQFTMHADWLDKELLSQRKGGGLRVKSIKNSIGGTVTSVRKFVYEENNLSTGILLSQPVYQFLTTIQAGVPSSCYHEASFLARMSSTINSNGFSSSGTIVGYDKVIEQLGESGEGGTIEHYYYNSQDATAYDVDGQFYPFLPGISYSLNGKEAVTLFKNAAGTGVKKIDYNYETKAYAYLKGVKVFQPAMQGGPSDATYVVKFYNNTSYWPVLSSKIETHYTITGSLAETTKYFYANSDHMELTSQEFTTSDGKTIIKKFKYPGDYTSAGNASFASQMMQRHIISPIVEEQTLLKVNGVTKLIGGNFTEYKLFKNAFYKPSIFYKINTNTPFSDLTESNISSDNIITLNPNSKPEIYFDDYNVNGNINTLHKANDLAKSYLWSYNNQYPIAEVVNANAGDIYYTSFEDGDGNSADGDSKTGRKSKTNGFDKTISGLTNGQYVLSYWQKPASSWNFITNTITVSSGTYPINITGQVDELRFFPKVAQMKTYCNDPLIGMTSATDERNQVTYYEYDGLNRLKIIRDNEKSILKKYDYSYADQNSFSSASLNALLNGFHQIEPGRMNSFYNPSGVDRDQSIKDTRLIYKNSVAQLPEEFRTRPATFYSSFNMNLADPYYVQPNDRPKFCFMEDGYSVEWAVKMPTNSFNQDVLYVGINFAFAATFKKINNGSLNGTYLHGYNDFDGRANGDGNGGNDFTNIYVDNISAFDNFQRIRLQVTSTKYRVYYNDNLVKEYTRSNTTIDNQFYIDAAFLGNDGAVDYIKVFDNQGVINFQEDFSDPINPVKPSTALLCPAPASCQTAFVNYFNQTMGTDYNISQITSLYLEKTGQALNVCN